MINTKTDSRSLVNMCTGQGVGSCGASLILTVRGRHCALPQTSMRTIYIISQIYELCPMIPLALCIVLLRFHHKKVFVSFSIDDVEVDSAHETVE